MQMCNLLSSWKRRMIHRVTMLQQHTRTKQTLTVWSDCRFQVVLSSQYPSLLRVVRLGMLLPSQSKKSSGIMFRPTEVYRTSLVSSRKMSPLLAGSLCLWLKVMWTSVIESYLFQLQNVKRAPQTPSLRSFRSGASSVTNLAGAFYYSSTSGTMWCAGPWLNISSPATSWIVDHFLRSSYTCWSDTNLSPHWFFSLCDEYLHASGLPYPKNA